MSDPNPTFEANLERLMQSSCGPNVRTTAAMKDDLRHAFLANLRLQPRAAEFPTPVLWLMGGVLALIAMVLAAPHWSSGWPVVYSPLTEPFGLLVLVNLVCLPIAALVIIIRRKYA
jgi:hypothetical protein